MEQRCVKKKPQYIAMPTVLQYIVLSLQYRDTYSLLLIINVKLSRPEPIKRRSLFLHLILSRNNKMSK